jgi:hypothetical protein
MKFLKAVIEYFTGRPVRTLSPDELARMAESGVSAAELPRNANEGSARAGFGLELDVRASYVEFERTRFEAQGVAQTADGQTIRFELEFSMERLYAESTEFQFRVGDARVKDPLALDFAGPAAALRIPRKLDSHSTRIWTVIPRQTGQSARSDAGVMGFTPGIPFGSSAVPADALAFGLFDRRFGVRCSVIHGRPPDCGSFISRQAGGRRWVTRRVRHGDHSGLPFLRRDSPSRSSVWA